MLVAEHLGFGLAKGDAVAQAADQGEEVAAAAARGGGIDLHREPELGRVELAGRKGEAGRHDADHEAGIAVEADVAAEDAAVAAEGPLPEAEGEHGGQRERWACRRPRVKRRPKIGLTPSIGSMPAVV